VPPERHPTSAPLERAAYAQGMPLRHHEIAETSQRILNPFTEQKLRLLGEVARVGPGSRILDLACGKGEMLCRWAEWFGAGGTGVDISTVFLPRAVARATELGVADRVTFVLGDARAVAIEPASFDIAACIGATWIGDGLVGTARMLRPAIRPGGLVLIGEPFWREEPPEEAVAAFGFGREDYVSLARTAARLEEAGLELLEMVLADEDSWDRYEAPQWRAISDWLAANPGHEMYGEMREFVETNRSVYLAWGRRYLGWGVFVARPR
jgi:SAM-dependent methyltransferase